MYTEINSGEILTIAASWFVRYKKARTGRNLPKKSQRKTIISLGLTGDFLCFIIHFHTF